jgi:hypothetical protein
MACLPAPAEAHQVVAGPRELQTIRVRGDERVDHGQLALDLRARTL